MPISPILFDLPWVIGFLYLVLKRVYISFRRHPKNNKFHQEFKLLSASPSLSHEHVNQKDLRVVCLSN